MADQQYQDYFNPKDVKYTYTFPDGRTTITFRKLTEGDRAFLQDLRSEIEYDRKKDVMRMDAASGGVKTQTIKRAAVEWDMMSVNAKGELARLPFETQNIESLLVRIDPSIVDGMYDLIVQNNTWISKTGQTKEEIVDEIQRLNDQLKEKEKEEKK